MNRKQIVVLGLDTFGMSTIKQLSKYNCQTLAIDKSMEKVEQASEYATYAAKINIHDIDDLDDVSLNSYDVAIITFSDIQTSILAALVCKENKIPMVIAKANDETHKKILAKMEVDKIISPEEESGSKLAKGIMNKNVIDMVELSKDYSIVELKAPEKYLGKSLEELRLRNTYGLNVLCIKNQDKEIVISPTPEHILQEGDVLVGIAFNERFNKQQTEQ